MKSLLLNVIWMAALTVNVNASELDRLPNHIPQGIVVKVDAEGNREVYTLTQDLPKAEDEASAKLVVEKAVNEKNLVSSVSSDELDTTTSNEAWYYWRNYSWYGYYYYGYSYYYYPRYSWYYRSSWYYYYY